MELSRCDNVLTAEELSRCDIVLTAVELSRYDTVLAAEELSRCDTVLAAEEKRIVRSCRCRRDPKRIDQDTGRETRVTD